MSTIRFVKCGLAALVLLLASVAPFASADSACHSECTVDPKTGQVCSFDCTRGTCTQECTEDWKKVGNDIVWGCKCWGSWAEECCHLNYVDHPSGADTIQSSGNCSTQNSNCPTGTTCITIAVPISGGLSACYPVCIP